MDPEQADLDLTAAPTRSGRIAAALARRWPTWLALLMSALTFGGSASAEGVISFANVLVLLPLGYLVVAKLRRREASWPTAIAGFVLIIALRLLDVISPAAVLAAIALIVLIWGGIDGQLRRSDLFSSRHWECSGSARSRWPGWW